MCVFCKKVRKQIGNEREREREKGREGERGRGREVERERERERGREGERERIWQEVTKQFSYPDIQKISKMVEKKTHKFSICYKTEP